jgi:hypothetical protein
MNSPTVTIVIGEDGARGDLTLKATFDPELPPGWQEDPSQLSDVQVMGCKFLDHVGDLYSKYLKSVKPLD